MNPLYDSAGLAIVAYAEVLADGTSPNTNSGVTTTKTGTGMYSVILPDIMTQSSSRDILVVTPQVSPLTTTPVSYATDNTDPAAKKIAMYAGSPLATSADIAFSIVILRTLISPPTGSPA